MKRADASSSKPALKMPDAFLLSLPQFHAADTPNGKVALFAFGMATRVRLPVKSRS